MRGGGHAVAAPWPVLEVCRSEATGPSHRRCEDAREIFADERSDARDSMKSLNCLEAWTRAWDISNAS
jgi:hypothetical protein